LNLGPVGRNRASRHRLVSWFGAASVHAGVKSFASHSLCGHGAPPCPHPRRRLRWKGLEGMLLGMGPPSCRLAIQPQLPSQRVGHVLPRLAGPCPTETEATRWELSPRLLLPQLRPQREMSYRRGSGRLPRGMGRGQSLLLGMALQGRLRSVKEEGMRQKPRGDSRGFCFLWSNLPDCVLRFCWEQSAA